jgi:hypothetical protein
MGAAGHLICMIVPPLRRGRSAVSGGVLVTFQKPRMSRIAHGKAPA